MSHSDSEPKNHYLYNLHLCFSSFEMEWKKAYWCSDFDFVSALFVEFAS